MKVIVTEEQIEIWREGWEECPGNSCREVALWMMAWAIGLLSTEIETRIHNQVPGTSVLCD